MARPPRGRVSQILRIALGDLRSHCTHRGPRPLIIAIGWSLLIGMELVSIFQPAGVRGYDLGDESAQMFGWAVLPCGLDEGVDRLQGVLASLRIASSEDLGVLGRHHVGALEE